MARTKATARKLTGGRAVQTKAPKAPKALKAAPKALKEAPKAPKALCTFCDGTELKLDGYGRMACTSCGNTHSCQACGALITAKGENECEDCCY